MGKIATGQVAWIAGKECKHGRTCLVSAMSTLSPEPNSSKQINLTRASDLLNVPHPWKPRQWSTSCHRSIRERRQNTVGFTQAPTSAPNSSSLYQAGEEVELIIMGLSASPEMQRKEIRFVLHLHVDAVGRHPREIEITDNTHHAQ